MRVTICLGAILATAAIAGKAVDILWLAKD